MKNLITANIIILFALNAIASHSFNPDDYDYVADEYYEVHGLDDYGTMLVTANGGGISPYLEDFSLMVIESTSTPYFPSESGIGPIALYNNSSLALYGGAVARITTNDDSTVYLNGGWVGSIKNYQVPWNYVGDPPVLTHSPFITIDCLDHFYDQNTNLLTGHWSNGGSAFSIELIDVPGKPAVIDNIQFIPEPMTLSLLGIGAFFVARKRSSNNQIEEN